MKKIAVACALVGGVFISTLASATTLNWGEEYAKRIKATEQLAPLGDDAFGDRISLFNGTVTFSATDISIPGNSALPVELTRVFDTQDVASGRFLADWDLDLPRLSAVHPASQPWAPAQRCSTVAPPPDVYHNNYRFLASDFWSGTKLQTRSGGGDLLAIAPDPKLVRPTSAHDFKWVTKDGWFFSCLTSLKSGHAGEGFLAHAPDGTRYFFDWLVVRPYPGISKKDPSKIETGVVYRASVRLYATRIEDRFGNWVEYEWSGDRLTRIHADDGRQISLGYHPSLGHLQTATAAGRTWTYEYGGTGHSLEAVVNPDGSRWRYAHSGVGFLNRVEYYESAFEGEYHCWPTQPIVHEERKFFVTHPAGATAEYTFVPVRHGRTNVRFRCMTGADEDWRTDYNDDALTHDVKSLKTKRVTGPGITESITHYAYDGLAAGYAPRNAETDAITGATPPPHYKYVTVTRPDGSRLVNRFGKDHELNEGQLMQVDVYDAAGVLKRSTVNDYVSESEAAAAPFPASMGHSLVWSGDSLGSSALRPLKRSTITQDSAQFSTETEQFDEHARPFKVYKSSSLGYARRDATTYHDDTLAWVIGQVKTITNVDTGKLVSRIEYDSRSQPWRQYGFGERFLSTLTYHPAGMLETVTDANESTTTLTGWKRGIPQLIRHPATIEAPAGATQSAVVDDSGWLRSTTDEAGSTTCYDYDEMGRVKLVMYPTENTGVCSEDDWNATRIRFEPVPSDEYGIPAGHWRRTEETGNGRKLTYFDALWRPIVEETVDSTDTGNTNSWVAKRYDHDGRPTFVSYPRNLFQSGWVAWANANTGVHTRYDALGRPIEVTQDSEHGPLATTTRYLPGFLRETTNPRKQVTIERFQAFDQPSYESPVQIDAPEGTRTTIVRDVFGKPQSMNRGSSN